MPRVTYVKSARQDNSVCKKGESYYWWKFRFGGKHLSLTRPSRSQLTQSAFYQAQYSIEDELASLHDFDVGGTDYESVRDGFVERVEELRDTCQESLENMPDSLQYSPSGELLQERIDNCEGWIDELNGIDFPDQVDEPDDEPDDPSDNGSVLRSDYPGGEEYESAVAQREEAVAAYEHEYEAWQEDTDEYEAYINELESAVGDLSNCCYPG